MNPGSVDSAVEDVKLIRIIDFSCSLTVEEDNKFCSVLALKPYVRQGILLWTHLRGLTMKLLNRVQMCIKEVFLGRFAFSE